MPCYLSLLPLHNLIYFWDACLFVLILEKNSHLFYFCFIVNYIIYARVGLTVCGRHGAMMLGIAVPTGSLADASPAPQGAFQALGHCSPAGPAAGAPQSTALLPVTGLALTLLGCAICMFL